jgi:hypothetical protein
VGHCVLCENTITVQTDSEEHLISNALGGRKKVSGLLCRNCNSKTGDSWDAELAAQLLPLCLLMDISRQRGEPPTLKVETTAGERLTIGPNGSLSLSSPEFVATPLPSGGTQYQTHPHRPQAEASGDRCRGNTGECTDGRNLPARGGLGHNLSIGGELHLQVGHSSDVETNCRRILLQLG